MSLRGRLSIALAVLVALGIGLGCLASYAATRNELARQVDEFLEQRAGDLTEGRRPGPGRGDGFPGPGNGGGFPPNAIGPDSVVQLIDGGGDIRGSTGADLPVGDAERQVAGGQRQQVIRNVEIDDTAYRMLTRATDDGAVQVARDVTEEDDVLTQLRSRLLLLAVGGAAVAALLGWVLARRFTRPLEELTDVAERVARDEDLNAKVPTAGDDEVGRLARSFDTMLGALATSKEQQRRLVQDASHELRTPLTSLRTNVELLARAPDLDPGVRQAVLDGLTSEVTELSTLVEELVQLATDRRDLGDPSPLPLADVATEVVDRFRRRTGRTVTVDHVDGDDTVFAHAVLLERAIANLLGNAHKFSASQEPIEVRLGQGGVAVRDHGPGIPAEERELVFQRFYRSETARDATGSGLGLAIVRDIVVGYGGRTFVGDASDGGGGAVVGFSLPAMQAGSVGSTAVHQ